MSNMTMKVEFLAGTSIADATAEAVFKAHLFNLAYIEFNFNGVNVSIGRNATVGNVENQLETAFKNKTNFIVVNS